jgi:hypothetical protein
MEDGAYRGDVDDRAALTVLSWDEYVAAVASPMVVCDRYLDVVAANRLAGAVSGAFRVGTNLARSAFLDPRFEDTLGQWTAEARQIAAALRHRLQRHHDDPRYRALLGELMTHSGRFADSWAEQSAEPSAVPERRGSSTFHNPLVGTLHLAHEELHRVDPDEHTIILWVPVDAATADRLDELRSGLPQPGIAPEPHAIG